MSNLNGATNEVWERASIFIIQFIMDTIAYPCWGLSSFILVKGAPGDVWGKEWFFKIKIHYITDDCQWKEYKDQYAGGGELQRGYMELDDCKRKCLDVSCKGIDFG